MSKRLSEGMNITIFVNGGKDTLKFSGEVLFVDDKFIEIRDERSLNNELICISHIVNIKINKEIERDDIITRGIPSNR